MKKVLCTAAALSLCAVLVSAQASSTAGTSSGGALSLSVMPGVSYALPFAGLPAHFYTLSPGVAIDVEYRLPFLPLLSAKGGIGYRLAPLSTGPSLSMLEATVGVGARFYVTPKIALKPYAAAGYHFGILSMDTTTETGGAWPARAGVDVQLDWFAPLGILVGVAGVVDGGAFLGIQASVGASYSFGAPVAAKTPVEKPEKLAPVETPKIETKPTQAASGLSLKASFDLVFPVFRAWYDTNPLGSLTLKNGGKDAITNIKASFIISEYMVGAWNSDVLARLEPGKDVSVPLKALFKQDILDNTTSTKSLAVITVDYQVGTEKKHAEWSESVRLQGRNEMTWADNDRRAAAFVTNNDPAVMTFARNVASAVKGAGSATMNESLAKAMAIHEAMRVFQMTYMKDPQTPYADLVTRKDALDRLQFPRETLAYKAGDCDDLSILYCALLESLAVDTAFITIPGHIFIAISTGLSPDEARRRFKHADELIFQGDTTWIPVEVTALGEKDDFLEAWLLGAKEWRERNARGQAKLYPLQTAWQLYEGVSLPKDNAPPPQVRLAAALVDRYQKVTIRFLDREMADEVAELNKRIADSKDDPKVINKLGVLYAKYGRYADAKIQFKKASARSKTYLSPLLNLGMIAYAENELAPALEYYEAARKLDSKNAQVLLGYARVNHELENYGSVRTAYEELKKVDPNLAAQFAYLDLRGDEAARAANISKAKEVTLWADQ